MDILLVSIMTVPFFLCAQPDTLWTKTFGGDFEDRGGDVICINSGFIVAGQTRSFDAGYSDAYIIKTNSLGDTVWTRFFGTAGHDDGANSLVATSDNSIVFTGNYGLGINSDLWVAKVDSTGGLVWEKYYDVIGGDDGKSIVLLPDGGYMICGRADFMSIIVVAFAVKVDSAGDTLWTKIYNYGGKDEFWDVTPANDGGFLFTGRTDSYGSGNYDLWLVKTDSLGDTLWTKTFGGSSIDFGRSIILTPENEIVIAGYTNSFGSYYQGWIIKTDSLGNEIWNRLHGSEQYDYFTSVKPTYDEGYILTGWTQLSWVGRAWLFKTDSLGSELWSKSWGGGNEDQGHSVAVTSDSGYIICGYTHSFGALEDNVWLLRVDKETGLAEQDKSECLLACLSVLPSVASSRIKLAYSLKYSVDVSLKIYDALGQFKKTIYSGKRKRGHYIDYWDGKDNKGKTVPNGVYFFNLTLNAPNTKETITKKLSFVR